jgi:hypothetical protein
MAAVAAAVTAAVTAAVAAVAAGVAALVAAAAIATAVAAGAELSAHPGAHLPSKTYTQRADAPTKHADPRLPSPPPHTHRYHLSTHTTQTHLCGCIIVGYVEPQPVTDGCRHPLPQTEGVATHKVCSLPIWVIQGVEEVGCCRREQVLQVLVECVDVLRVRTTEGGAKQQGVAGMSRFCRCWATAGAGRVR